MVFETKPEIINKKEIIYFWFIKLKDFMNNNKRNIKKKSLHYWSQIKILQ